MVKLEKPGERGPAASWGRRGRLGQSPSCSPSSRLVFSSFRGGERGDSASGERSPGPARRRGGYHGARARGARRLQRARRPPRSPRCRALVPRPPLPASGRRGLRRWVRRLRARLLPPLRKSRVQQERSPRRRAERRGCPDSRSRSAPPPGAAAAAPAVGGAAELQAAPRVPGRPHLRGTRAARGGAGRDGAGPRHLSSARRRRLPAHLFSAPWKVRTGICPRKRNPGNFWHFSCRRKKLADWLSDAKAGFHQFRELAASGNFRGGRVVLGIPGSDCFTR